MVACHLALLCGALAIAAPTVAVPVTSHALHLSPAQSQWFAAGYQLMAGPLHVGAGRLADRFGPRRILLTALALFTAGSLLAATAADAPSLIAARLLQGTGGSALSPVSLALLLGLRRSPSGNEARAVAGWVSTAATASCLGPLLGGCLTDVLGWRGVFGALAVLAAVTACCCARSLPAHKPLSPPVPVDTTGIALCTGAAAATLIALTGPTAATPPTLVPAAALSAAALLALLVRRTRCHPHPALDPHLLRRSPAKRALVGLFTLFAANSAFTFLAYFHLSHAHALGPLQATLVMLPATVPAVLTARAAAARSAQGQGPVLLRAGLLAVASGLFAATAGLRHPTPLWLLGGASFLVGCGLGLANGAAMTTVAGHRAPHHTSRATAMATTFAMLGGASGPAVAGAVLSAVGRLPFLCGAPSCDLPGAAFAPAADTSGALHGSWAAVQRDATAGVHLTLALIALTTATAAFALTRRRPGPAG